MSRGLGDVYKRQLPVSELFDLTLPPVDAVGMSVWPKPASYYASCNNGQIAANNGATSAVPSVNGKKANGQLGGFHSSTAPSRPKVRA